MKYLSHLAFILLFSFSSIAQIQLGQDIVGEKWYDQSGLSVSLSSNNSIVAIGAPKNDGNGGSSGHVRIYNYRFGVWTQVGDDIDGEAEGDLSGSSVSLSSDGSIVAIGAPKNDGNGYMTGHVRIYQNRSSLYSQVGEIDGEAVRDQSGFSVSLSSNGNIVAIGAPFNDGNGSYSGHVRIYQNQSGVWTQVGDDIDGEAENDRSGYSVSLSSDGSVVAIGARTNDGNGSSSGHVRIYQNQSGVWTQVGDDIDGEAAGDLSGSSVSLSSDGSIVAIGAYSNDGNGSSSGHVRVYQNQSGVWTQVGDDIDGEAAGDWSGYSVSLSSDGSAVAIGGFANDGNGSGSGHVRIYQNQSGVWTQIGDDIDGETEGDWSGSSVSLSSNGRLAVGAPLNGVNGNELGQVKVYDLNGTLGVSDLTININVYPNPATDMLHIVNRSHSASTSFTVLNPLGQEVLTGNITGQEATIDVSSLSKGYYLLDIGEGEYSYRFIVQ